MLGRGRQVFDLIQLRHAVAAADCGSVRRAAESLRGRHSNVSRSIRELEHSLGVTIFERSASGVTPTRAGRGVLQMARIVLEQADALVTTARSVGRGDRGRLSIGFYTSISTGNLRATLLEFKARFPQVELVTFERSRARLLASMQNGAIDVLVIAGETPADGVHEAKFLPLWSERILAMLLDDHPLAVREAIFWTDLRGDTVLLSNYDLGRELETLLMSKLVSPCDRPTIERHDVSRESIKSLIGMRLGIGLVTESDTGSNFAGLTYRELRDGTGPSRLEFGALWRPENENPVLNNFIKLLAERYPFSASSV